MKTVVIGLPRTGKTTLCILALNRLHRKVHLRLPDRPARKAWRANEQWIVTEPRTWTWRVPGPLRPAAGLERLRLLKRRTWGVLEVVDLPGRLLLEGPHYATGSAVQAELMSANHIVLVLRADRPITEFEARCLIAHLQDAPPGQRALSVVVTHWHGETDRRAVLDVLAPVASYLGALLTAGTTRITVVPTRLSTGPAARNITWAFAQALLETHPIKPRYRNRLLEVVDRADHDPTAWRRWRWTTRTPPVFQRHDLDRGIRCGVTVFGDAAAGRAALLAGLFRALGPRERLWLHASSIGELHELERVWQAPRADWRGFERTFTVVDGTRRLVTVEWGEIVPGSGSTDAVQHSDYVIVAVGAEHLLSPVSPGRSGELRKATGLVFAGTALDAAVSYRRSTGSPPPVVMIVVTSAGQLATARTREGLTADLRLLLPAAFAPDIMTLVTTVVLPATPSLDGVNGLAHALLIAALHRTVATSAVDHKRLLDEEQTLREESRQLRDTVFYKRWLRTMKIRRTEKAADRSAVDARGAADDGQAADRYLTDALADVSGMIVITSHEPEPDSSE